MIEIICIMNKITPTTSIENPYGVRCNPNIHAISLVTSSGEFSIPPLTKNVAIIKAM